MELHGTTILAVLKDGRCAVAGDGQVTMNNANVMKAHARKVRRIYHDRVVIGFAGSVADACSLSERFEQKLEQYGGALTRAAGSLAQDWRSDKIMHKLEALLIATDGSDLLIISGSGEVIDPDDGVCAIGSGVNFALEAARALVHNTSLSAVEIAVKALEVAASICVFTNDHITVETL